MKPQSPARALVLAFTLAALSGCGRSGLLDTPCALDVTPDSVDFGDLSPGANVSRTLTVRNDGAGFCQLASVGLVPGGDPGFTLAAGAPASLGPDQSASLTVGFAFSEAVAPFARSATLRLSSNDSRTPALDVPLRAHVHSGCALVVSPSAVDFGHVAIHSARTASITLANRGVAGCSVADIALAPDGDREFELGPGDPTALTLAPGATQTLVVLFSPDDAAAPHHRTSRLTFTSNDEAQAKGSVPLSGDIDVGCNLTINPTALSFGNVVLNATAHGAVALGNDGSDACHVSGIALAPGTDPGFALVAGQPTALTVPPGGSASIALTFTASDSQPPHLKTGLLVFETGNSRAPDAQVPLSAYVNTTCVEASQWIYTVTETGLLSKFDPLTLQFTDIAQLACPTSSRPNSMAVDQNGIAWVAYLSGEMFQVDLATATCQATGFQADQAGLLDFGMGFVFDPTQGTDTLYIAGGQDTTSVPSTLATISFPDLRVTPIGPIAEGFPELTGTGDGQLWGFFPGGASSASGTAELLQIDPASGKSLARFPYPTLPQGTSWAVKFWGGSFWLFLGSEVIEVKRDTPKTFSVAIPNSGHVVVGAGVSTCAPVH